MHPVPSSGESGELRYCAAGTDTPRKMMIVALARKLLIALLELFGPHRGPPDPTLVRFPQGFSYLDPVRDVQVLCPMNLGGVGARSLTSNFRRH